MIWIRNIKSVVEDSTLFSISIIFIQIHCKEIQIYIFTENSRTHFNI